MSKEALITDIAVALAKLDESTVENIKEIVMCYFENQDEVSREPETKINSDRYKKNKAMRVIGRNDGLKYLNGTAREYFDQVLEANKRNCSAVAALDFFVLGTIFARKGRQEN